MALNVYLSADLQNIEEKIKQYFDSDGRSKSLKPLFEEIEKDNHPK